MTKPLASVALASISPRRKYLLETLGLSVQVVPTAYEEKELAGITNAGDAALHHALAKAELAEHTGPPVLIAADTIVELDGEMLGKPRDPAQALDMLRKLAGRHHHVYTGFTIMDRSSKRGLSGVEATLVRFLPLSGEEIAAYVATGEPMDKAGAYGILGRGALLVSSVSGDFYTVVGLPLARIGAGVRELGYRILSP
jgi:septum formation protein